VYLIYHEDGPPICQLQTVFRLFEDLSYIGSTRAKSCQLRLRDIHSTLREASTRGPCSLGVLDELLFDHWQEGEGTRLREKKVRTAYLVADNSLKSASAVLAISLASVLTHLA
jgi:hypothetical protein